MKNVGLVAGLGFVLLFTMILSVPLVSCGDTIYIRASGAVEGTDKITTSDNTLYTFTDNINGYIIVEKNNIFIDGASHKLQGDGDRDGTGIFLSERTGVTIQNLHIENFEVGVWLHPYATNNIVTENTFVDNRFAVELDVSSYNTISDNTLTDNGNAIWLDTATGYTGGSNHNTITGNNITLCFWDAIGLANGSGNNTINDNTIVNNQYAITISSSCSDNTVSANFIDETDAGWGISLEYQCNNNIIAENTIKDAYYGIELDRSTLNEISDNTVQDSDYAIRIYKSEDNKLWHNSFIDNSNQVYFDGDSYANTWDNGYPSGGNYWSDYTGTDSDSDGIGDTPYTIDENNHDNYPLVGQAPSSFETLPFTVNVEGTDYTITTCSNSTVTNFQFSQTQKQISFNVEGPSGTTGLCNVTIPVDLMWGNFTININDATLTEGTDYTRTSNGTHCVFSITYTHSSHTIKLTSTDVIPEFAAWLLVPLFISAMLLTATIKKKLQKQQKLVS